ncbi:hypothetical protein FNO01nite_22320 [Flavobacterium noncentrifugens]|uniref:YD repeat-containing protein n=1 Tax=Flavobacterium noncentrifugens TaxID=1128970 RepID=A0A1G9ATR2_9FLAO|nr:hypothetical protein [Flavobacterium noncentrifugens]GEP51560.1 hypothetical protein FNO01nite_22320 [Flavobacterium noncentrifugens]SDK29955.1 YD repeat-containing protein [Flavobacterium noncentrifugens]
MKTTFYTALLLLFIGFSSCSSDDDNAQKQPETHANLLTKINDVTEGLVTTIAYDSSNKMISFDRTANDFNPETHLTFTYDAAGLLSEMVAGTAITKYFYNAEGKLTKTEQSNSGTIYSVHQFVYAGSKVTDNYNYAPTNQGWKEIYTFENGNVTQVESYSATSAANPNGTYEGTFHRSNYDGKPAVKSSMPWQFQFPDVSANNVGTSQYCTTCVSNFVYEYNADGYPTKRTENGTATVLYEYKRL